MASPAEFHEPSPRTVRHLLKRYREQGAPGLPPGYHASSTPDHAHPDAVRQAVLASRRGHPTWGAELIRVMLADAQGSRGDLPTDPVCWLAGLDVAVTANPPRPPQDNGVVGRSRGVGKQWREPRTRGSSVELGRRLGVMDHVRRERYPSVRGRSRREAYPGLEHSGRPYDPALEETAWDLGRVWGSVGSHRAPRRVDRQGKLSVYNRPYGVGVAWASQAVWVGSDPLEGAWTFQDEEGHEIRRQVARELSRESVVEMEVTDRRKGAHATRPAIEWQRRMRIN